MPQPRWRACQGTVSRQVSRAFRQRSIRCFGKHRGVLYVPAHRRARSRRARSAGVNTQMFARLLPYTISCDCGHTARRAAKSRGRRNARRRMCRVTQRDDICHAGTHSTRKKFVFDTGKGSKNSHRRTRLHSARRSPCWLTRTEIRGFIFRSIKSWSECIRSVVARNPKTAKRSEYLGKFIPFNFKTRTLQLCSPYIDFECIAFLFIDPDVCASGSNFCPVCNNFQAAAESSHSKVISRR